MLISTAQQGRQKSSMIKMLLCRITPTCSKFLLPNVCVDENVETLVTDEKNYCFIGSTAALNESRIYCYHESNK